jgi:DNA repair protein SbcD/Mre11
VRLLHTADWHVGRSLQGRNRLDEQRAVLAEIASIARDRQAELILITGDLFDSASPSPEAESVVYGALLELSEIGKVVVTPGNHDSDRRLQAVTAVFGLADVTIRPFVDPQPLRFESKDGEPVVIATLPWISQRYVVKAAQLMDLDAFELGSEFKDRVGHMIERVCEPFSNDSINLFAGHLSLFNATLGGGERTAQTIFEYCIDATAFPGSTHYVALGHMHKAQKMPGPCPIYYCGAPLHLDFSDDEGHRKVNVVDARPGQPAEVHEIELTSGRRLRTVTGTIKQLEKIAENVGDDHLRVIVTSKASTGLGDRVRELFPNAVKVIAAAPEDERTPDTVDRHALSPQELFARYLDERDIEDQALVSLFSELYEECV